MDADTEQMTAELAAELAANDRRRLVDPRTEPLRFFNLKAMGQSAAHCLQSFQFSDEETLAKRLGAGTHALLFELPVAVWTGKVRNGKVWDAFKAEHSDKTILNAKEHAKAKAIVQSIRNNPIASRLLWTEGTIHEKTIYWDQAGRRRRSTPDARSKVHLVDLKTTRCAEPDRFARDARFRGYHAQLADYRAAMVAANGYAPKDVYIIAVETVLPYAVTCLRLTERALEIGDRLCRSWFERFRQCEESNSWPGYCESITDLDVPDDDVDLLFGDEDEPDADE